MLAQSLEKRAHDCNMSCGVVVKKTRSSKYDATCSRFLITSLTTMQNRPGAAALPWAIVSHSIKASLRNKRREGDGITMNGDLMA